jgi:hypothetical protein
MAFNYPKSSCLCYNSDKKDYDNIYNTEFPTIGNCNTFLYDDNNLFSSEVQPTYKKGYINLNPQISTNSYDKNFEKINCSNNIKDLSKNVYISNDPRLISSIHNGQVLPLNLPPNTCDIKLDTLNTDNSLNRYGQNYKTYSDINAGQITYYVDKSIEGAFFEPNFSSESQMFGTLYKDPMGTIKPQYDRQPLTYNSINTKNNVYTGGLSWIQDSQEHRQDLLALQMRRRNQERWEPRWAGIYK